MTAKRKTTRSSKEPEGKASRPAQRAARKTAGKAVGKSAGGVARKTAAAKAGKSVRPKVKPTLQDVVLDALADMKAVDVKALDVRGLTDITDTMVVASGTSDRHVKSIADRVVQRCKEAGFRPFGMEGERDGDWVLVDLHDVVLHVMLPRTREFYALEKLWEGGSKAA
jgi:ribosome silencing factor RsfS/YbeB/iojap